MLVEQRFSDLICYRKETINWVPIYSCIPSVDIGFADSQWCNHAGLYFGLMTYTERERYNLCTKHCKLNLLPYK